ncbi:hypothetical protein L345_08121, partial [Ophiophagus hannah]
MVPCLSGLRSLRFLSIRDNAFSSKGICLLANSFNYCRRISEINIRFIHCGIDQPDLRVLCAVFENCDHLAELDLSGNDLDNEGLRWIFEHLPKIQNSCSLNLCPEKMLLIILRKQDKTQKILSLKEWNLQVEQLAQLLSRLKECTVLSNFMLTWHSVADVIQNRLFYKITDGPEVFQDMPKKCSMRKAGSLFMLEQKFPPQVGKGEFVGNRTSRTLFPDAEGPTSFDALMYFPALQKLWLTDGRIPPASIEYIAEILQQGFAIEDIKMGVSKREEEGFILWPHHVDTQQDGELRAEESESRAPRVPPALLFSAVGAKRREIEKGFEKRLHFCK